MTYSNDPDLPQFFSADLCTAAKIDTATLKNWISREPYALRLSDGDRRAIGTGRQHLFTYRTVMQAAICAEFVVLGLSPRRAGAFAELFMNLGEGGQGNAKRRAPGELFPTGSTVLVAYPAGPQDKKELWASQAVNMTTETRLDDVFKQLNGGREAAAVMINISMIHDRVRNAFGPDYAPDFRKRSSKRPALLSDNAA
jgi:hypothetical protein